MFQQGEDRQQFIVTAIFVGLIGLLVFFLIAAVALSYYNDNIRAVANVGGTEIGPGMVRERGALLRNRLNIEEGRITQALTDQEIDALSAQQLQSELAVRRNELGVTSIEGLIDLVYQSQLAAEMGISVSDAEVDAAAAEEAAGSERRRVEAIFVEPQVADEDEGPTLAERRAARERAEQALTELEAGRAWADVARDYSTHESKDNGGDFGTVSPLNPEDEGWISELFRLSQGETTGVILGADGTYRIGRVTEILPSQPEPGLAERLLDGVSDQRYREFLRYELTSERLRDQIVADAKVEEVEQIRLAHVFLEGATTGEQTNGEEPTEEEPVEQEPVEEEPVEEEPVDGADEGEIHYSEIVFAPNDDVIEAPDLPADDPAWEEARLAAEATFNELSAITDPEERADRFAELATEQSDSPTTAEDGGDAGFMTRDLLPEALGVALFDSQHTEGDLIGPVRSDAGYVVMLFHERRESPQQRLDAVKAALAAPGADFAAIARQYSDGDNAPDGGELGWFTREMLNASIVEQIFALQAGDVSEPIELGSGVYIFKALERAQRALDADQQGDIRENAFERWYAPKKDDAELNRVIVRADETEGSFPGFEDEPFDEP
jgi:parvulin-like peptidyl-prolyl isomerase